MKNILILFLFMSFTIFCQENVKKNIPDTDIKTVIEKLDKIEKRVDELEKKLNILDENLKELKKVIRNLQIYTNFPQEAIKVSEEDWKLIRKGMVKEEVERILGNPDVLQKSGDNIDIWIYYKMGRIYLNPDGRVIKIETDKNLSPESIFR